ncbi:MAG: phosphoribosylformylglycinamidine synthase subunit PurS [Thermoproteota archaeon]|jgi:phosphoribosylformylglycinamidine synthase
MTKVRIEVKLKQGYFDPEGNTIAKALKDLNFPVSSVRISKVYTVELNATSIQEAKRLAEDICRKLLVNPVKDDFKVEVVED